MNRKQFAALLLCAVLGLGILLPLPASASSVRPGYRFTFGRFEQDGFTVNGEEPIVWRVLDTDDTRGLVLAVSEYGLYTMKYHRNNQQTRWGDTDVRNWLNSTFASSFTAAEQRQVARTKVSGSEDLFFLLDAGQVSRYLDSPYLCYATPWALGHGEDGAYVNEDTGASSWLVRTDSAKKRIAWVGGGGILYTPEGKKGVNYLTSKDNVVRPAMWISREAVGNEATDYALPLCARMKMNLSTRSGPTTGYNGVGDYPIKGQAVHVLSRVHDGSIWWLQIEFEYKNTLIRCYTGLKRVDISISKVPDEAYGVPRRGTVLYDTPAWYGPGTLYKQQAAKYTPPAGTAGSVITSENGWVWLEYLRGKEKVRVWLPAEAVSIDP